MRKRFALAVLITFSCWLFAGLAWHAPQLVAAQASLDFARDIQPILQANCVGCHNAQKASGQLRLDDKTLAFKGGLNGVVLTPHNSKAARLLHRVKGEGGEQRMPLGKSALSNEQIALLTRWIDEGATWPASAVSATNAALPQHWAFVAPQRPALPVVKNRAWVRNPIDHFVLAHMEKAGFAPNAEADKATLLRRLSLDLTGLPPTLAELDAFLNDSAPNAYDKQVERLLASPHYGERWGRWWLDAARYADSNGYEKDRARSIWPYRDWVIRAFNSDKRFDEFTREQLAGDLLPPQTTPKATPEATLAARVATGFIRNSMRNEEGGVDPEQFRVEEVIDRVDATGKAFLGLTVNCAQCHSHKFDPIKHDEYYKFFAFFNSDLEAELDVPDAKAMAKREQITRKVRQLEDSMMANTPNWQAQFAEWETATKQAALQANNWQVIHDMTATASFGVKFERLPDGSFAARGDASTNNTYVVRTKMPMRDVTGIRLDVLSDVSLPHGGPGRRNDGVATINDVSFEIADASKDEERPSGTKIAVAKISSDFESAKNPAKHAADGDLRTAWTTDTIPALRHQDRHLVFNFAQPLSLRADQQLVLQIAQKHPDVTNIEFGTHPVVGRFRLSVTTAPQPQADVVPARIRALLFVPSAHRTTAMQRELFYFYRTTVKEWAAQNQEIETALKDWPYGAATMAVEARTEPRKTYVFKRGDWKRPDQTQAVEPGTPAFLHPYPANAPRNRLGLAEWILAKENPLTSRVIVNRIWQNYFGSGLVATPEDLGTRCDPASHPALLDWLAREFWDNGRSFKAMQRLIVTSATYRQSSHVTPQLLEKDPTNQVLARMPRLRVESELIRDIALSIGGLLSAKVGGPSVFPPIPDGVMSLSYGRPMPWTVSEGEDRYRRGMYTFWKRNVPYPALQVFDMPNGDFACTRRIRSNTPLQALTILNDATYLEAAQAFGLRIWREGGTTDEARLRFAFRLCTGRWPVAAEQARLQILLDQQRQQFAGKTAAAVYVSSLNVNQLPDNIDLHQLAPWTMVARTLLNLDETITRE